MASSTITPEHDGKIITVHTKLRVRGALGGAWSAPPGFDQSRTGARGRSGTCRAARRAARAAQRKRVSTYRISTDRNEFPANFPRISVSSPLYPAKAPRRRTRSVVTRDECRAHPSSRHTHKRCFASRMRRIALKWRSIRHCDWGIAHRYFLSFFLHMRGGNYGSGHSASTLSRKIARFSEHPGSIHKLTIPLLLLLLLL